MGALQSLAPFATAIVGLLGVAVAFAALRSNRRLARLKATLDFIDAAETKPNYVEAARAFAQWRHDGADLRALIHPRDETERTTRARVLDHLNHYEIAAIGCRAGLFNERIYLRWCAPFLLRDHKAARPFIAHIRETNASAFREFDRLAHVADKPLA